MKWLLTFVLNFSLLWLAKAADSSVRKDFPEEEFTCPLDGHQWKQRMEGRGQPAGLRLDLKQVGDVIQPASAPHCPKCGLVLFTDKFPEQLVQRLKPFILSPDFQILSAKSPVYAKLAVIQEFLGAGPIFPAYSYLKASWEVEGKPSQHQRYLAKALDYFTRALAGMQPEDKDWLDVMLLCGELERRLQRWDAAADRFQKTATAERIKAEPGVGPVVKLQMKLIAAHDSLPHLLGDLPGASVKPASQLKYSPMEAVARKPKKRLQPLDMNQSLVLNVEEPALPQRGRPWANASPLPNPPAEALPGSDSKAPEAVGSATETEEPVSGPSVFPELAALPAPKAQVRRRPETKPPKPAPKPEPVEVEVVKKPTPKPEPKEVVKKAPPTPKPEPRETVKHLPPVPKPEPKETVKNMPPEPKPEPPLPAAVLAPKGEKKSRPKLIGEP